MNLADLGSLHFRGRGNAPGPTGPGATVGFTSPLVIESEAKNIDTAARVLLGDMQTNLPASDPLRQSYETWFQQTWSPFFAGIKSFLLNATGAVLFGTDERFALLQTRRGELADFATKYQAASGKPTAAVIPADPRTLPKQPSSAPSWWPKAIPTVTVPWWAWMAGGATIVIGGYLAYRSWQNQRAMQSRVIESLPRMFPETAPVAAAYQTAVGHDCPSCGSHP